jgi:hypothetical protein
MKKEVVMILLIIGLPLFFIMNFGQQTTTGAAVNELAQLRIERINLYLNFETPANRAHKNFAYRIRQGLLANSNDRFYYPYGLGSGNDFLDNEGEIFYDLGVLACEIQPELGPEWSIGTVPCDTAQQSQARYIRQQLAMLDYKLIEITVQNSNCPANSQESMILAQQNLAMQNYDALLTNLRSAWSKTKCA